MYERCVPTMNTPVLPSTTPSHPLQSPESAAHLLSRVVQDVLQVREDVQHLDWLMLEHKTPLPNDVLCPHIQMLLHDQVTASAVQKE